MTIRQSVLKELSAWLLIIVPMFYLVPVLQIFWSTRDSPFGASWIVPEMRYALLEVGIITLVYFLLSTALLLERIHSGREKSLIFIIAFCSVSLLISSIYNLYSFSVDERMAAAPLLLARAAIVLAALLFSAWYLLRARVHSNKSSEQDASKAGASA